MNLNPSSNIVSGNIDGKFIQDLPSDNNVSYADLMRSSGTLQATNKFENHPQQLNPDNRSEHYRKLSESPPRSQFTHFQQIPQSSMAVNYNT